MSSDRHSPGDRIRVLEQRAAATARSFSPTPPDETLGRELLYRGVGPTVAIYCQARTGDSWVRFDDGEFARLEATLNHWLELYAACYGIELSGTYSVRTAAELLVDTHDIQAVAQILTGVPDR